MQSKLLLNKHVQWVCFHGSSDFAYLLHLFRNEKLPPSLDDFYKSLKVYFPSIIDLKFLVQEFEDFQNLGLSKLG